jgi:hypothetical protein
MRPLLFVCLGSLMLSARSLQLATPARPLLRPALRAMASAVPEGLSAGCTGAAAAPGSKLPLQGTEGEGTAR